MLPIICNAGNIDCEVVRQGIYKVHGLYGSLNTIVRTNEKQIETIGRTGTVFEYEIQWTSNCTFWLLNRKTIKGTDSLMALVNTDTIYNEIRESNRYWHKVAYTVNGCEPIKEISYFKIDTTSIYKDLSDLEKFKDYKGAKSGGTLVGYNYAVTYKQHSENPDKYLIAFLEGLVVNGKSRFRILDNINCDFDTTQKITTSNCRFNNKYDKEIIAIYCPADANEEAQIIRAWRFNKIRLRIEEVAVELVKFKGADKRISMWDE